MRKNNRRSRRDRQGFSGGTGPRAQMFKRQKLLQDQPQDQPQDQQQNQQQPAVIPTSPYKPTASILDLANNSSYSSPSSSPYYPRAV